MCVCVCDSLSLSGLHRLWPKSTYLTSLAMARDPAILRVSTDQPTWICLTTTLSDRIPASLLTHTCSLFLQMLFARLLARSHPIRPRSSPRRPNHSAPCLLAICRECLTRTDNDRYVEWNAIRDVCLLHLD